MFTRDGGTLIPFGTENESPMALLRNKIKFMSNLFQNVPGKDEVRSSVGLIRDSSNSYPHFYDLMLAFRHEIIKAVGKY